MCSGEPGEERALTQVNAETANTLRGLAAGEPSVLEGLMGSQADNQEDAGLLPRDYWLCRIATLIALDAPRAAFRGPVDSALAAGISPDELVGVLVAAAPQVGLPRLMAAAPELMLALGVPLDVPPG